MGLSIIVQWPGTIYLGGINGLQKQVQGNIVTIIMSTIRGGGAVLLLWLVSPTLHAFFLWQIGCNFAQTITYAILLQAELRDVPGKGRFDWGVLKQTWKFSAGMFGISILATLLTQTDKVLLSKLVPLEQFGYYVLAGTAASVLFAVIGPINGALFPRFTELVSLGDETNLASLFHSSCQLVSFVVFPLWAVLAFFSREVLFAWTHNHTIANSAGPILSLVATGNMLNLMMHMPYNVQLAYAYTKLTMVVNSIAVVLLVPLIYFLVRHYGINGGATAWIIVNGGYVFIAAHFVYRRYLKAEKWHWYVNDILRFAIPCVLLTFVTKYFAHFLPQDRFVDFIMLAAVTVLNFAAMLVVMPRVARKQLLGILTVAMKPGLKG
jgi:O-antigen/teichoic acid export membrane protein